MRTVTVSRTSTSAQGTFGMLVTDSGLTLSTGELPWRGNMANVSCILPGQGDPEITVQAVWAQSPKHGWCYHVLHTDGRSDVEIHKGNWCGDTTQGFKSDVLGCMILGETTGILEGQQAVLSSGDALTKFETDLAQQPFMLTIKWALPNQ